MRSVLVSQPLEAWCAEAVGRLLDLSEDHVQAVWAQVRHHTAYTTFILERARERRIHVPTPLLAAFQRRILDRILYIGPVSPHAYGGVPGRTALEAACRHFDHAGAIVKLDVRDAFGNTTWGHVAKALRRRLKTELRALALTPRERAVVAATLAYLTTVRKGGSPARRLPLGSPTSTALFNLVFLPLDRKLSTLPVRDRAGRPLHYTRYVDDLVFSSPKPFDVKELTEAVEQVLRRARYHLRSSKTWWGPADQAVVYGLRRTRRGVEPSVESVERMAAGIRRHSKILVAAGYTPEMRQQSRAWLRGVHGYLGFVYEKRGLGRPGDLVFEVPVSHEPVTLPHMDDLWR